jgi:ADP-ribose pyrophosphatase YjhB (NUDIX family)
MEHRKSVSALAVIISNNNILLRFNKKSGVYFFIGGQVKGRDTFKQSLVREIAEETKLKQSHYNLMDSTTVEFTKESKSAGELTDYTMTLYQCAIVSNAAFSLIEEDPRLMWVSMEEIMNGSASDGKPISDDIVTLLGLDVDDSKNVSRKMSAEEKALEWVEENIVKHFNLLTPEFKNLLVISLTNRLKMQDRDTRHACAEAVIACKEVCETPTGDSAISPDDAHNACMNVTAV